MKPILITALAVSASMCLGCAEHENHVQSLLRERSTAARWLASEINWRMEGWEGRTAAFVEQVLTANRLVAASELALAEDSQQRITVAKALVQKQLNYARLQSSAINQDVTRLQVVQANVAMIDASMIELAISSGAMNLDPSRVAPLPADLRRAAEDRAAAATELFQTMFRVQSATSSAYADLDLEALQIWVDAHADTCRNPWEYRRLVDQAMGHLSTCTNQVRLGEASPIREAKLRYMRADFEIMRLTGSTGAARERDRLIETPDLQNAEMAKLAEEHVVMTKDAIACVRQREKGGEAVTPSWLLLKLHLNRRAFDSRVRIARTAVERDAAAQEYLDRAQYDLSAATAGIHEGEPLTAAAKYEITDAQFEIARIKPGE